MSNSTVSMRPHKASQEQTRCCLVIMSMMGNTNVPTPMYIETMDMIQGMKNDQGSCYSVRQIT